MHCQYIFPDFSSYFIIVIFESPWAYYRTVNPAADLFKYAWPISGHQALKGSVEIESKIILQLTFATKSKEDLYCI